MIILAIDTALDYCSVGIKLSDGTFHRNSEPLQRGHSEVLVPKIQQLLRQANISFKDLGLITVSIGPGSFTGLRVGIATAKGIALAAKLPLVGVSTFEILAYEAIKQQPTAKNILVAFSARREDIYCQLYDQQLQPIKEPSSLMLGQLPEYVSTTTVVVVGNRSIDVSNELKDATAIPAIQAPDVALMCELAQNKIASGQTTGELADCKPFYLRPPSVMIKNA